MSHLKDSARISYVVHEAYSKESSMREDKILRCVGFMTYNGKGFLDSADDVGGWGNTVADNDSLANKKLLA